MQIPAKRIKRILLLLAITSGAALAQNNSPDTAPPAASSTSPFGTSSPPANAASTTNGTPAAATPGATPVDNTGASTASAALEYLYNHKPQQSTAAEQVFEANEHAKDHAIASEALGLSQINDPQVRAKFEKYLGMKEVPASDLDAYGKEVQKITDLLRSNQTFAAWKELQVLGSYEGIDAGVSYELANRIESIWNTDKATYHIASDNQRLQQQVNQANSNADLMSGQITEQEIEQERERTQNRTGRNQQQAQPAAGNGAAPPANPAGGVGGMPPASPSMPTMKGLEGRLELSEEYLRSLEGKAKIKLNELKEEKLLDAAKSDFAEYIKTLYNSGRHEHVILAADFYRKIFDEDEYPVDMADEVNASLEIARDVAGSVEVFRFKSEKNELAAATARLQEAFTTSEFQPPVLGLERSEKQKVEDYITRLDKMQNLIEAHDFGPLENLIDETKNAVADFDATKPLALVNAVKLESKLHLGKAKLSAQQGDLKTAMDEFQEAAKAWPANPDLQDSSTAFFNSQDTKSQSTTEFDRLVGESNYREIFDKQLLFATAVHGDSKREEQLKDALVKIKNAEIAAEKANVMRNAGDVDGAWETIELAAKDLPNDNKLNALRADLAGKGAEFVEAINKAKDAETRSDLGYSLSWYAVAQRYYPASVMANEAIDRLSKQILKSGNASAF